MIDQPPRTLCCWPGLAGLWLRGHWSSLFVAVGFSLLLNLALVSSFVWPGILGPEAGFLIWPTVIGCWLIFGWVSWQYIDQFEIAEETPKSSGSSDDTLFNQAQTEYLKGEFTQAELLLAQRLQAESRDAEARLLLASLYRRTDRFEKALGQLDKLQRLDSGIRWQFEMKRERALVEQEIDRLESEREPTTHEEENLQDEDSLNHTHSGTITLGEAAVNRDETAHEDKPIISSTIQRRAA